MLMPRFDLYLSPIAGEDLAWGEAWESLWDREYLMEWASV
jgi:hypothetical protein